MYDLQPSQGKSTNWAPSKPVAPVQAQPPQSAKPAATKPQQQAPLPTPVAKVTVPGAEPAKASTTPKVCFELFLESCSVIQLCECL
jgi:hypothetical protein